MLATQPPFGQYFDTNGTPLDNGAIYFGTANVNPLASPVAVFWDAAGTMPAAQPIRTKNGYTVRNGAISPVYLTGEYSVLVRDRRGRQVVYAPNSGDFSNDTALSARLDALGSGSVAYTPGGTGAVARTVQAKLRDLVSVADFGVTGNGTTDDTSAMNVAISAATALGVGLYVPGGFVIKITSPLVYPARFRIVGGGMAVEGAPRFVSYGGVAIFQTIAGFQSESASFEHIAFDSAVTGTGTGLKTVATAYISQTTFRNCVFYGRLQYGIDGPIILCRFYDCDFGSYPADFTPKPFQAIRAIGTIGSYEPNANTFVSCVFRRSSAARTVEVGTAGVQWNFHGCDFEQNTCTSEVILFDGGGSLNFYGGYAEANTTPYLIKTGGNLIQYFCNLVQIRGMHFNSPCTTAILKRTIIYPLLEITGCYGQLNCNIIENEVGALNQMADVEVTYGNHYTAGTGSFGTLASVTTVGGYNARGWKALSMQADAGLFGTMNGSYASAIEKASQTVTAVTTIATLSPAYPGGTSYSGLIHVTAQAGVNFTGNNNIASYLLNISKDNVLTACTLVSAAGQTTGAAANQPSFTWSMSGNDLRATPVGSTTGTFSFLLDCSGNVKAV